MKTIGYGLIQIPVVTRYHVFCIKRTLAGGVTSTGWQQILGCALRILLLSAWGLQSIDYSLPQTAEKLIGIYIEYAILATLLGNGIVVLVALWSNNLQLFYPALIIIPVAFVTDIVVKATCYAALFLTPHVTSFGILSLVEVWFRGLSLMYGWIILISYIHYKKKDWELAEVDVRLANSGPSQSSIFKREPPEGKSPFSRNSSISQRGRRSFLLRHHPSQETENKLAAPGVGSSEQLQSSDQLTECGEYSNSFKDTESAVLLGESATMSLTRTPTGHRRDLSAMNSTWNASGTHRDLDGPNLSSLRRSPPRYKKRGGFVPEVLRATGAAELPNQPTRLVSQNAPHTFSESTVSGNTINVSHFDTSAPESEQASLIPSTAKRAKLKTFHSESADQVSDPPALPNKPPVGSKREKRRSLKTWFKKGDEKPSTEKTTMTLDQNHVQEPVLV